MKGAVVLAAIVAEELEEACVAIAQSHGAKGATVLQGRGIGFPDHKTFFGLTYVGRQSALFFVLEEKMAKEIVDRLNERLLLEERFKGLAFTLALEESGGIDAKLIRAYLDGSL